MYFNTLLSQQFLYVRVSLHAYRTQDPKSILSGNPLHVVTFNLCVRVLYVCNTPTRPDDGEGLQICRFALYVSSGDSVNKLKITWSS